MHTVDGREIDVNPRQITSMHETKDESVTDRELTAKVRCAISLTDGKFVSVVETCAKIREMLK